MLNVVFFSFIISFFTKFKEVNLIKENQPNKE